MFSKEMSNKSKYGKQASQTQQRPHPFWMTLPLTLLTDFPILYGLQSQTKQALKHNLLLFMYRNVKIGGSAADRRLIRI